MANYSYTCLDRKGKKLSGNAEGEDRNAIRKSLKEKGLYVVEISEISSSGTRVFSG
jgi:type II secretory pathway component PulF